MGLLWLLALPQRLCLELVEVDLVEARARDIHQMRMRRGDGVAAAVAAVPLVPTTTMQNLPAPTATLLLGAF